jgi:hypothetical protein
MSYGLYNLSFQIAAQKGKPIPCIEHFEIAFKCAKCPNKDVLIFFTSGSFFCLLNKVAIHLP